MKRINQVLLLVETTSDRHVGLEIESSSHPVTFTFISLTASLSLLHFYVLCFTVLRESLIFQGRDRRAQQDAIS